MLKSFFLKPEITGFRNFTVSRFCSLNYSFLKASDISLRFGMFSGLHCCSVIKELAVPFYVSRAIARSAIASLIGDSFVRIPPYKMDVNNFF